MNTLHRITSEERIEEVITQMTPEEKAAQLHGVWLKDLLDENGRLSIAACEKHIPHGVGQVCQFASACNLESGQLAGVVRDLQRFLRLKTRLGIPAICQEEAISGFAARGATTYPQQIGISCSWNTELLIENTRLTARLMRIRRRHTRPFADARRAR